MTSPSEPLYGQHLGQVRVPPAKPRRWTPPFLLFLALFVLLEAASTLFALSGKPLGGPDNASLGAYLLSGYQAGVAMGVIFIVVDVIAVWLVGNPLLRAAFLLRIIVSIGGILIASPLQLARFGAAPTLELLLPFSPFWPLSELALGILGLVGQLCLSYGLVRWHPSDNVFIWVQLLLTLGIGYALFRSVSLPSVSDTALSLRLLVSPFLAIANLACLLCRPACWKAHPLLVFCFTIGNGAVLLFNTVIDPFFYSPGNFIQSLQTSAVLGGISGALSLLGLLLLIQQQRLPKKVTGD